VYQAGEVPAGFGKRGHGHQEENTNAIAWPAGKRPPQARDLLNDRPTENRRVKSAEVFFRRALEKCWD